MSPQAATHKGNATREMIVARAYDIAARHGLEGLSIGELATAAGMSKSGVFAHFFRDVWRGRDERGRRCAV